MKKIPIISRIFLFISLTAGALFFGVYVSRYVSFYQIFDGPELQWKSYVTLENLGAIFQTLSPLILLSITASGVFLVFFYLFIFTSKLSLRNNGWLLIITLFVTILAPFHAYYFISTDIELLRFLNQTPVPVQSAYDVVIRWVKETGMFFVIHAASFIAYFYLLVFQPFVKVQGEDSGAAK